MPTIFSATFLVSSLWNTTILQHINTSICQFLASCHISDTTNSLYSKTDWIRFIKIDLHSRFVCYCNGCLQSVSSTFFLVLHVGGFYSAAASLAMKSAVLATAVPSVCPSVGLCPTLVPCPDEWRITWSSLWGSKHTLVFWYQQWLGATSPST